jgi:type IV pilus assembly protein PilW
MSDNIKKTKSYGRLGVTLVELLVVIAMGLIVSGVAFSIYRVNSQYFLDTEASLQQQRNLRVAMLTLTRELRMAGNGLFVLGPGLRLVQAYAPVNSERACSTKPDTTDELDWFANCDSDPTPGVRAIFGEDGGTDSSDIVTIFKAEPEFSESIGEARQFTDWELTLATATDATAMKTGDILGLVHGDNACLLEVETVPNSGTVSVIKIKKKGRYTGPSGPPTGFPVNGAMIYNLKDVTLTTYYVDESSSQLMAIYHDQRVNPDEPKASPPIAIADNIEDLQLFYFFDNEAVDNTKVSLDPGIGSTKLNNHKIHSVSVGLTAKSIMNKSRKPQIRPALFNRAIGTVADQASRLSLLETVQLRNAQ